MFMMANESKADFLRHIPLEAMFPGRICKMYPAHMEFSSQVLWLQGISCKVVSTSPGTWPHTGMGHQGNIIKK